MKITLALAAAAVVGIASIVFFLEAEGIKPKASDRAADLGAIRRAAAKIAPLHVAKKPPGSSDWLAQHNEPGQTFEEYRKSDPNGPSAALTTIYIIAAEVSCRVMPISMKSRMTRRCDGHGRLEQPRVGSTASTALHS